MSQRSKRNELTRQAAAPDQIVDPAADLAIANPVLARGQFGVTSDTGLLKIGDGTTAWNDLPEFIVSIGGGESEFEVIAPEGATVTPSDPNSLVFGKIKDAGGDIYSTEAFRDTPGIAAGHSYDSGSGIPGVIKATGAMSLAFGYSSGTVESTSNASFAHGEARQLSTLTAAGRGSTAFGVARYNSFPLGTYGSQLSVSPGSVGSMAFGDARYGGVIDARTSASVVFGRSRGVSLTDETVRSGITATSGTGNFVGGVADYAGQVHAGNADASVAFGMSAGDDSLIAVGRAPGDVVGVGTVGAQVFGYAHDGGKIRAIPGAHGAQAFGYANDAGTITASGEGSFASGKSDGAGSAITASFQGAFASGYAYRGGTIVASNMGALAFGISSRGTIEAGVRGSVAIGSTYYANNSISALRAGTFALGFAGGPSSGTITTDGYGALAMGMAYGGTIDVALGADGAFALGAAFGGALSVSAKGALAFGYAGAAETIEATAAGAVQFAPGTNAVANSVAVGTGLRFNADGAPAAPRNGDMWIDGAGNIIARSNGVNVTIA